MLTALIVAVILDWDSWLWDKGYDPLESNRTVRTEWRAQYAEYCGKTNLAERIRSGKRRPRRKERDKLTPEEAFHRFANGGVVPMPKDERPAPYRKAEPEKKDRKPRK